MTDRSQLAEVVAKHDVDIVFHLAATLFVAGEKAPTRTFDTNVKGLRTLIRVAREHHVKRIVVPSSIAVYGPATPQAPDERAILDPTTMYGVTKAVTEYLGRYYSRQTEIDVRGIQFPGMISHETKLKGGTTDYAVNVYYDAIDRGEYTYFVREDTRLPMIYMPDAVRALVQLADADRSDLRYHCEYNVTGPSFTPTDLTTSIRERVLEFEARYTPDERQEIADSWPSVADDTAVREDWGWDPEYDLDRMSKNMLKNLENRIRPPIINYCSVVRR